VCEGAVPRNDAVAIAPLPYSLIKMAVFCEINSDKLEVNALIIEIESILVVVFQASSLIILSAKTSMVFIFIVSEIGCPDANSTEIRISKDA